MQETKLSDGEKSGNSFTIRELWVVWYSFHDVLIPHLILAPNASWAGRWFRRSKVPFDRVIGVEKHSLTKQYRSCLLTKADIRRIGMNDRRGSRREITIPANTAAPKAAK